MYYRYQIVICTIMFFSLLGESILVTPQAELYPKKGAFEVTRGDSHFTLSFFFWPEFFFSKNLTLLNNNNPDKFLYFRSFVDTIGTYSFGKTTYNLDCIKVRACVRNRTYWGDKQGVLLTTEQPVRDIDTAFGRHRHGIFLSDLWMRELWIELALNDLVGIPWCARHMLTVGAFLFELGRGISLGYNYPLMPTFVGFFTEVYVDQYAWGARLTGELEKDQLYYTLYGSIFRNDSVSFDQTNENIRSSEYGHRFDAARGFGMINYLGAARLQWYPLGKSDTRQIYFEPYVLFNWAPELHVEPRAHGESRLTTFGLMGEFLFDNVEWGFECGFNRGGQRIFGVDRNSLELQDRAGTVAIVNDEVTDMVTGQDALVTPEHQLIINNSARTQLENGKPIGGGLINKRHRFQDPYRIRYRGLFFVADGSYIFKKDVFKVSAAIGIATGDRDPRIAAAQLPPGPDRVVDYHGFIAINETYAGKRVTSSLFFNGFGAFPRVFDFGIIDLPEHAPILNASGFTNLIYAGASCDYQYKNAFHCWHLNPNLLFFWHETPAAHHEPIESKSARPVSSGNGLVERDNLILKRVPVPRLLSKFLGIEINMLAEIELLKDFSFFVLGAIFIPGFHYKHMKDFPLPGEHKDFVREEHKKRTVRTSRFGHDTAYFANCGFKFTF